MWTGSFTESQKAILRANKEGPIGNMQGAYHCNSYANARYTKFTKSEKRIPPQSDVTLSMKSMQQLYGRKTTTSRKTKSIVAVIAPLTTKAGKVNAQVDKTDGWRQ